MARVRKFGVVDVEDNRHGIVFFEYYLFSDFLRYDRLATFFLEDLCCWAG